MGFATIILKDGDIEINVPIPKSYRVVINNPVYRAKQRIAIKEELKALIINSIQKEEVLLKGTNLVSTKQVFTVKVKADNTLDQFKAQLVIRGFSQIYRINYFEIFALTI